MRDRKISQLRSLFSHSGVEAVLVSNPLNVFYLSGFHGTEGSLLISQDDKYLITDFRYLDQAQEEAPDWQLVRRKKNMTAALKTLLAKVGISRLGFESEHVTYNVFSEWQTELQGVDLIPLTSLVESLRACKDSEEVRAIRGAAAVADKAFSHILDFIKPGVREEEVAAELECFMRKHGAEKPSFDAIVASGSRGAMPHAAPSQKKVEQGDLVIMDFGAVSQKYCSDITRTVAVGPASSEQRKIYNIVLEAQAAALNAIQPGKKCSEIDAVARNVIASYGYGEHFGHGLGHGVGLEVHENPSVNTRNQGELVPGAVVTIEPGIYISGWGGVRIEDMVLITDTGLQVLTQSKKELIELK